MATSFKRWENENQVVIFDHFSIIGENLVKISPVDPEVIGLKWGPLKHIDVTETVRIIASQLCYDGG